MINYTLFAQSMQTFDIIAEDAADAHRQLTMFAVSLTKSNGRYKIQEYKDSFYLRVTGVSRIELIYQLVKQ
jgi:hypothetical protein